MSAIDLSDEGLEKDVREWHGCTDEPISADDLVEFIKEVRDASRKEALGVAKKLCRDQINYWGSSMITEEGAARCDTAAKILSAIEDHPHA